MNGICLNGPAKGQELYFHDGWEPVEIACEDGIAMYRFCYVDNEKFMCKFIGMQEEPGPPNDVKITEEIAGAIMEAHSICYSVDINPVSIGWGKLLESIQKTYPKIFFKYFWRINPTAMK